MISYRRIQILKISLILLGLLLSTQADEQSSDNLADPQRAEKDELEKTLKAYPKSTGWQRQFVLYSIPASVALLGAGLYGYVAWRRQDRASDGE